MHVTVPLTPSISSLCALCTGYIWNIDIMQARARRLERKMEEDQVRRALRYLTKYISKVEMVPRIGV